MGFCDRAGCYGVRLLMGLLKLKRLAIVDNKRCRIRRTVWEEVINGFHEILVKAFDERHDSTHFSGSQG
jgi:hypothetical protein